MTFPQIPGWGGDTPPQTPPHSMPKAPRSSRLRRSLLGAFCAGCHPPPPWFYQQIPSCLDPPLLTCGEYSAAHAAVNSVLTVCTCRQYTCTSHGGTVKLLMWLVVRRLASFMTLTAAFLAEHNKQTNAFITSSSYNKTAYSSGLAVASLTAVREVLGSNCAVGSCVYRKENLKALGTGYAHPSCMQCLGQLSLLPSVDEYQLSG